MAPFYHIDIKLNFRQGFMSKQWASAHCLGLSALSVSLRFKNPQESVFIKECYSSKPGKNSNIILAVTWQA